jgi:hypothetical protein
MKKHMLFLLLTGCPQAKMFDHFDDDFTDSWHYTCNDHEDDSQVVIILDHCDTDGQYFVRSEVQMLDHEKYWGAMAHIRQCHWESVIVLDKNTHDHSCSDIDFVNVERFKKWDGDTGDTGSY